LLAHKADVNAKGISPINTQGFTALHRLVLSFGYSGGPFQDLPAMAEMLLAAGADPNLQDVEGKTPLNRIQLPPQPTGSTQEKVAQILRKHGALDQPPDPSSVRITRKGSLPPRIAFKSPTNSLNRFSLLEVIGNYYADNSREYARSVGQLDAVGLPGVQPAPARLS